MWKFYSARWPSVRTPAPLRLCGEGQARNNLYINMAFILYILSVHIYTTQLRFTLCETKRGLALKGALQLLSKRHM